MIHYELVKVIINAPRLADIIIEVVIWHQSFLDSIVTDSGWVFISKFGFSLYYFLRIKQKLSIAIYLKTDGQAERQNSIIKT